MSNPGEGTASLEKALDVLDVISEYADGVSQSDLSRRIALPRTTLYRILATLTARGMVRRDPARHMYCLGFRCVEMARRAYAMPDLVSASASELRALRDLTGETSYVGALEGIDVVSLERFDSPHTQRSNTSHGHRKPVYATSQGKAILAALPLPERNEILAAIRPKAHTHLTITDRRRLLAELRIVASRGFAIDDEENVPGTRCVGAAIVDAQGAVRGAISVAGPEYRLSHKRLELLGPELVEAARHIGASLPPLRPVGEDGAAVAVPTDAPPALYGAHPVWCTHREALVWADTLAPALRLSEGTAGERRFEVARPIRSVLAAEHGIRVFHERGSALFDETPGLAPPATDRHVLSVCIAPEGAVWAACVDGEKCRVGELRRDGRYFSKWVLDEPVDQLCFDARTGRLYATLPESGDIAMLEAGHARLRTFARIPKSSGTLRGLAIDPAGGVWVAMMEGWSVIRLTPDGQVDQVVPLPVPSPTGIAIGGRERNVLYVTTARQPVPLDLLKKAPLSGRLFRISLAACVPALAA